jgi:hypothetical protein
MKLGETNTVEDFIHHMRNAVAHGRITFSSDSRDLEEVTLTFEDGKPGSKDIEWRVCIDGKHLRQFCTRFMDLIQKTVD